MPQAVYARLQQIANKLITNYGQTGKITEIAAPPNPVEGGDPVTVEHTAKMFPDKYEAREIDGTVIKTGDVKLYISSVGLSVVPSVGMYAEMADGNSYRIENADPNRYDGVTNVVFIVQGRIAA
ncbi:hypothetical protein IB262_05190 [Ensifer sp. ENS02]|uniref:hypothetical protein n=1 Tax=Ensifer sp. ENS02 TaxID=2769290 RepID=UPI001783DCAD|nr:hypothetical protein [Ensifer sp. ENS02]MBD9519288.1 hypothetical protein [Ensifer sp. ENS02]